jgi:hypothetical protein
MKVGTIIICIKIHLNLKKYSSKYFHFFFSSALCSLVDVCEFLSAKKVTVVIDTTDSNYSETVKTLMLVGFNIRFEENF